MPDNVALALVSLFAAQEAVAVYCLPTLIALVRRRPDAGRVAVINMYLGWTVIGWLYTFVKVLRGPDTAPPDGSLGGRHVADDMDGEASEPRMDDAAREGRR